MKIGLVGWGIETQSAYQYFGNNHDYLIVNEEPRDDFPSGNNITVKNLSERRKAGLTGNVTDLSYLKGLENCDLVVITPVARKNLEKVYPPNSSFWQKATTSLDIFFEKSPTKNIIGVTGTKGKGTTATLIYKILQTSGVNCYLAGNIGKTTLNLLAILKKDDYVVLELSNFQLYKFTHSPHIAVQLMTVPEHITEWHKSVDDYTKAKRNIFLHQTAEDIAVFLPTDKASTENAKNSKGTLIPYTKEPGAYLLDSTLMIENNKICNIDDIALIGQHNLENICAAVTVTWQITKDIPAIQSVLRNFTGLDHRLQLVRTFRGVEYYNDSFGTTPDTAIVAMDAIDGNKIMIIGGHDKGSNYGDMINRLQQDDVKHVIGVGATGNYIVSQLAHKGVNNHHLTSKETYNDWTMQEIIDIATANSKEGDKILLSTGSASFGIFKNYKERGKQFTKTVQNLQ